MSSSEDDVPEHYDNTDTDASDIEEDEEQVQKRKRGPNKKYKQIDNQKLVHQYDRSTEIGLKQFYKCNFARKCEAFGYILLHAEEETKVTWYSTEIHDNNAFPQESGIPGEIKEKIKKLLQQRVTSPQAILTALEVNGIDNVSKKKIVSFLAQYRKKTISEASISLTTLKKWCEERENVPENRDTPFVGSFTYKLDSDELSYFRLFVTTIRLLQNALKSPLVAADGT